VPVGDDGYQKKMPSASGLFIFADTQIMMFDKLAKIRKLHRKKAAEL
jgi:hypothetical protein